MFDIVVDVEADGPAPGLYSMVSFGAAALVKGNVETFYSEVLQPISKDWIPDALAISHVTREEQLVGRLPKDALEAFDVWLASFKDRPLFWSDNPAFDGSYMSYYTHAYLGRNPLGWSGRRIGDLYCGHKGDLRAQWKHLRDTKHTHHPVADATANLEALIKIKAMLS